ncbi:hypothetical protein N7495_002814 [Penicillium taxi]|uniref:uncharacterized protein n=1 Tax=Penicillium taxi TaxID=168475 RepID=UPI002544F85D|nr:uncharacterized protein N7495_002814 [Penicillium taxi]KAJ5902286.1 hypothetical protein N7495_002814 [Penicillium taxi]
MADVGEDKGKKPKAKKSSKKNSNFIIIVHPSTILLFPNFMSPNPNEVDNYPLAMEWILEPLSASAKKFKDRAFETRIKDNMTIAGISKLMIGSPLTTPEELSNSFLH